MRLFRQLFPKLCLLFSLAPTYIYLSIYLSIYVSISDDFAM